MPPTTATDEPVLASDPTKRSLAAGSERDAFLRRAMRVVETLAQRAPSAAIRRGLSEPNDLEAMLAVLDDAAELFADHDPLLRARLRGMSIQRRLLERSGDMLGTSDVAELLGVSRQAVHKRRRAGKLLAMRIGRRDLMYPQWQFTAEGVLPGLAEVLDALDDTMGPWMTLAFFLNANGSLQADMSPLEALQAGELAEVVRAARLHGEHGAA